MANVFLAEIISPDGTITDVTDRVDIEELGGFSYGIEDSLLQFRAGDLTMTLDDSDGAMAALFTGADPTQTFRLRVARNDVKLFEGIIALPGNVKFSANEASCELNAFGYLAYLDQLSAETVKRTFTAFTVSGTAGSAALTFAPSLPAGLTKDDQLRIADATNSETVTVLRIAGNVATLTANLSRTWPAGSAATIETPYYRRRTPTFLATELFKAAGIPTPTIDLSAGAFAVPAATDINPEGLIVGRTQQSACQKTTGGVTRLRVRSSNFEEYEAVDTANGGWAVAASAIGQAALNQVLVDWLVYKASEPTTLVVLDWEELLAAASSNAGLGVNFDTAPPRRYIINRATNTVPAPDQHTYTLQHQAWNAGLKQFAGAFTTIINTEGVAVTINNDNAQVGCKLSCDYDAGNDLIYFAYGIFDAANGGRFGFYDNVAAGQTTLETAASGGAAASMGVLRYSRDAQLMLRLKADGVTLQGWRRAQLMFQATVPAGLVMRTMRHANGQWVGIVVDSDRTRLLTADTFFGAQTLLDFATTAQITLGTDTGIDQLNWLAHYGSNQIVGNVNAQLVVIDRLFAGVLQYADFSGKTIAGALVEIAKVVNAVAFVDQDFLGFLVSRNSTIFAPGPQPPALDALIITQEEDAVWEKWFGRVTVRAPTGEVATLGDASLAASELDIESDLIPNLSVTSALAYAYKQFYGTPRRTRRLTVDDDETVYMPYQRVTIGPEEWAVYEIDYHWVDREVALRLVEAI